MARLIVLLQEKPYRELVLNGQDVTLGSDQADDLILADERVSIRHAELRFQDGQYVLLDLASATGVWVGSAQVQQAVLSPGAIATIGPFRVYVDPEDRPARSPGGPADATLRGNPRAVAVPDQSRSMETSSSRPAKGRSGNPAPKPGLIAGLARLPKPVLFGGVSFLLILVIALKVLTTTDDPPLPGAVRYAGAAAEPAQPAPDNNNVIAQHLASGRARIQRGEYAAAIKEDIDVVLLIDKTNAEALALKAEADERLNAPAQSEQIAPPPAVAQAPAERVVKAATEPRTKPAAPPPPQRGGITPQPGETTASWQERMASMSVRYNQAVAAARAEDYATAAALLTDIVQEEPRYRDAAKRLADVHQVLTGRAKAAFDAAVALEQDDDLVKARTALERACAMPHPPAACGDTRRRIAEKMQTSGDEAFRRAKVFDAQGRLPEAIALYQRAVQLLASDDPNRRIAQERLDVLKPRR